jgi:hypothetical protein
MLKIGNMDGERVERLGALAAKAADNGAGSADECTALAERRLKSGMNQSADVLRAWLR